MPELAFFVGKGGVGKTTISAAYALSTGVRYPAKPVLLISTDPAHSLADVLQIRLQKRPTTLKLGPKRKLRVWEMNSAELFRRFVDERRDELLDIVEQGSFFTREEVSALLDTTLPGISEIGALLAIQSALDCGMYSRIVVDTAPFGHTLRLFGLPEQFLRLLRFLELAGERDRVLAESFGGRRQQRDNALVRDWTKRLLNLETILREASLFLVTTAESFALNESVRCMRELHQSNPHTQLKGIVLNRVITGKARCGGCSRKAKASRKARMLLKRNFPNAKINAAEDCGVPPVGVEALQELARHVFSGAALRYRTAGARKAPALVRLSRVSWPPLNSSLSLVVGKGGVGKTTISAGLAFRSRQVSSEAVEICSVDPAPSLDDVFGTAIEDRPKSVLGDKGLRASEFDSVAHFKRWVSETRAQVEQATAAEVSGVHIDLSLERRLFSELLELVPPGVDEVLSVFRLVDLSAGPAGKVIIDMAPTGHALELLRTPDRMLVWSRLLLKSLATHRKLTLVREAAARIAELEVRARELAGSLRNSMSARVFVVMLPELLPDRETRRLLAQLDGLGVSIEAVFVNRVLLPGKTAPCARCGIKAEWQVRTLQSLKRQLGGRRVYLIRDFPHEIAGRDGLKRLTRELWQLN